MPTGRARSSDPLRRSFRDRSEVEAYLRETFKDILARQPDGDRLSPTRGGADEAASLLRRIDPQGYKVSRNHLRGQVTKLSPFIRHGVLALSAVRDAALDAVHRPDQAEKLISELGWRDYWQRVYARIGDQVWDDQEPYKTGFGPDDYADEMPADLVAGNTGLACMDAFSEELTTTGYLHNHSRMWVAAYVVHWLKVKWQVGARWFLRHLLDGDPASNNLSWQWVASTFSHKPYIFNQENLARFTDNRFCPRCSKRDECPFNATYDALNAKLFKELPPAPPQRNFAGGRGDRRQRPDERNRRPGGNRGGRSSDQRSGPRSKPRGERS